MENRQLITKNKKIFIKKTFINLETLSDTNKQLIVKTLYSTCKHGTEKWIIEQNAHWLKYLRDRKSNYFTNIPKPNFRNEQNLGNMAIGKIVNIGSDIKLYKKNDLILIYGSAADYQIIEQENIITKVKKNIPIENYLCFDPLEFSVGAIRESNFKIGDKVGIVGMGVLGLISLLLLKKIDINQIVVVDVNDERLKVAKKLGAHIALNSKIKKNIQNYRVTTNPIGLDVVIDFSGSTTGLNTAISLCKYNGKVIAGSMYPEANSNLKLGQEFHWNNIEIISSRICNDPQKDYPAWNRTRLHDFIINLIESKKYKFTNIIKKIYPFRDALKLYKKNITNNKILKLTFKHNVK
jgi:threonine dehydrogenase-like Zn-dependent dehydrogenase